MTNRESATGQQFDHENTAQQVSAKTEVAYATADAQAAEVSKADTPGTDTPETDAPQVYYEKPEVLQRLKDDGEAALADAFDAYRDRFWQLVQYRMDIRIASRVDADDVLQEAYLGAVSRLSSFLDEKTQYPLFVWLRMLVIQTLVDVHRRHLGTEMRSAGREVSIDGALVPSATSPVALAERLIGDGTSPSGAAIKSERSNELVHALSQLSENDRETIALRHFEGLSNNETAQVLGIGVTAASNRYVRALQRLKQVLDRSANQSVN
ncbi:MAG: sigma-70 family RNA polymerase sigma factor [Planctomycetota bacterium]